MNLSSQFRCRCAIVSQIELFGDFLIVRSAQCFSVLAIKIRGVNYWFFICGNGSYPALN